ncbi:MAG TPA: glycoside hydrolase family 2 TIM barrel-domain containing protein [Cytophagaceae bacterium]
MLGELLQIADSLGMTVALGLDLAKEINGFSYKDEEEVEIQFQRIKQVVERYKDHPALLFWIIGNEVNQGSTSSDVWKEVNRIAEMIHETDPEHPVTTSIIPSRSNIMRARFFTPEIDFLSFNIFHELPSLSTKLDHWLWGWKGAYVITEWGPQGWWETTRTSWKAPLESNSTSKSESYKRLYPYIANDKKCMGSYSFYWGSKQEKTPTWFSMFVHGDATEAVDIVAQHWSGITPDNHAPGIKHFWLKGKKQGELTLLANEECEWELQAFDNDKDTLTVIYEIRKEVAEFLEPYQEDELPQLITSGITKSFTGRFNAPEQSGPYRIYIYVKDGKGKIATANIPFWVSN